MIVDNFAYLRDKLDFSDKNKFYMVQLQQRKKDDESFPANNRTVKTYFIDSLEDYDRLEPEMKKLSDETGARVYIRLNRRSYEGVALQVLRELAQILQDKNFQHLKNIVASAAGKVNSEPWKNWIIDIDYKDWDYQKYGDINKGALKDLELFISSLEPFTVESKVKFIVPTFNGCHLITSPFNCQKFKQIYPNIDIHKDNPTLLYFKHD